MVQRSKAEVQISIALFLGVMTLILFSLFVGSHTYQVAAQAPVATSPPNLTAESLSVLGLSADAFLQTQALTYNLTVDISPNTQSANNGDSISYTITITNTGPYTAPFVLLYTGMPVELSNVHYEFSVTNVISDNQTSPIWVLNSPLVNGATTVVTVTGTISTACTTDATGTAYLYNGGANLTDDDASISLHLTGAETCALYTYFPIIWRSPTPTPNPLVLTYSEDFSSGGWYEYSNDGCTTDNRDNRYWVEADAEDRNCLPPAKDVNSPQKTGEFEVKGYHSEDLSGSTSALSNGAYGLFINGNGGGEYYYFIIWPNNSCSSGGDWRLVKRYNNSESTLKNGSCNTAINRGGATNTLRIAHKSDGTLVVYANGTELGRYTDSSDLDGTGTGVYARSDNEDVRFKFDDFKIYKYQ